MLNWALLKTWENYFIVGLMVIIPFILINYLIERKVPDGE